MSRIERKSLRKFLAVASVMAATTFALSGCSGPDGGEVRNVTDNFSIYHLNVNGKNVVCYDDDNAASTVCDFKDVDIPNGVEIIKLTDDAPHQDKWKLSYLVNLKNETADCVSHQNAVVDCDFGAESSKGSYGGDR